MIGYSANALLPNFTIASPIGAIRLCHQAPAPVDGTVDGSGVWADVRVNVSQGLCPVPDNGLSGNMGFWTFSMTGL